MKIQNKLFIILFTFSLVLVAVLVLLAQWSIKQGVVDYVSAKEIRVLRPMVAELASIYQAQGSWQSMVDNHRKMRKMLRTYLRDSDFTAPARELMDSGAVPGPALRPDGRLGREPRPLRPPRRARAPAPPEYRASYALLRADKSYVVGDYPPEREYNYCEIRLDEQIVGYLAVSKRNELTQGYEIDFINQQRIYLWWGAGIVVFLVALLTLPLARHLVSPLRQVAQGMHKLTLGDYGQRLSLQRRDEFAQLSRDFNELAQTLQENDSARKRWLANIAHELRTPVAILRGELEAMLDGIRQLSQDNIASAHQEVIHLQRLIEDLHQLTSADIGAMNYRKEVLDIAALLQREAGKYSAYLAQSGLNFSLLNDCKEPVMLYADATRLCQLFDNVVNNCAKYASTGTQVQMALTCERQGEQNIIRISIADDGPGVSEQDASLLFEHLYRVDSSRNRQFGGSGLGLSIVKHIVEAHQGKILAQRSTLGGLAIIIDLPGV